MEEKEVEKREKGKSGFGKSPFCFCLTVSLPLLFFPCTHHTKTHAHTHPPPTIHHDTLAHTIKCKQGCVLCCLFWEWTARHTASSTPHTPSLDITQHTNQPNTDTAHGASNNEITTCRCEGNWTKGQKVGQHSSTNTLIEAASTQ